MIFQLFEHLCLLGMLCFELNIMTVSRRRCDLIIEQPVQIRQKDSSVILDLFNYLCMGTAVYDIIK